MQGPPLISVGSKVNEGFEKDKGFSRQSNQGPGTQGRANYPLSLRFTMTGVEGREF